MHNYIYLFIYCMHVNELLYSVGKGVSDFTMKHETKCSHFVLRKGNVGTSTPFNNAVQTAMANTPQSFEPLWCYMFFTSICMVSVNAKKFSITLTVSSASLGKLSHKPARTLQCRYCQPLRKQSPADPRFLKGRFQNINNFEHAHFARAPPISMKFRAITAHNRNLKVRR